MSIYDEIEKEQMQNALDSCASEEVRLRKPIKPTSEQITIVAQEIKKYSYVKNYWVLAERAINTWEKIKGGEK